jgi:hypothetical protein
MSCSAIARSAAGSDTWRRPFCSTMSAGAGAGSDDLLEDLLADLAADRAVGDQRRQLGRGGARR